MAEPAAGDKASTCRDCPVACHKPEGGRKKNRLDAYAALWRLDRRVPGFGDFVAAYHRLCDDIGVEAFEIAAAIASGIKAGRVAADENAILQAVGEISEGTALGRTLGGGAADAGRAWGVTPPAEARPRKETGRSEAEEIFLDTMGLCAFACSRLTENRGLWISLTDLLKAKYGPAFDGEKITRLARAAGLI